MGPDQHEGAGCSKGERDRFMVEGRVCRQQETRAAEPDGNAEQPAERHPAASQRREIPCTYLHECRVVAQRSQASPGPDGELGKADTLKRPEPAEQEPRQKRSNTVIEIGGPVGRVVSFDLDDPCRQVEMAGQDGEIVFVIDVLAQREGTWPLQNAAGQNAVKHRADGDQIDRPEKRDVFSRSRRGTRLGHGIDQQCGAVRSDPTASPRRAVVQDGARVPEQPLSGDGWLPAHHSGTR